MEINALLEVDNSDFNIISESKILVVTNKETKEAVTFERLDENEPDLIDSWNKQHIDCIVE